jgi:chromate transporter
MIAATFYIMKDVSLLDARLNSFVNIAVIVATFLLLQFTRVVSPVIVIACLLLGYLL